MGHDEKNDANSISAVVDEIAELADEEDDVAVRDLLQKFGDRSFAPLILILSLVGITPVSGIPGVPSFIALCIVLVAGQLAFGRDHIWMPSWIADRSADSEKLSKGTKKLRAVAELLDKFAKGRLSALVGTTAIRVVGALIVLLCLAVPPLELIPLAAAIPFLSIAILALAVMVRDGLVMLIGGAVALAAIVGGAIYFIG